MEKKIEKPKKKITVFLIMCTLLLSLSLIGGGIYSLYISIGFRFLQRSAIGGLNTSSLYTYSTSGLGTGSNTMFGMIIISLIMMGLGFGMIVIFFKQLPLYKQIKFIAKMPNVKYKDYSKQVKKSVITYSILAYIICIAFCIFAIISAFRSGIASNYIWVVVIMFGIVLALSISSMVLMFVKLAQLSKIKKHLISVDKQTQNITDIDNNSKTTNNNEPQKNDSSNSENLNSESVNYNQNNKPHLEEDVDVLAVGKSSFSQKESKEDTLDANQIRVQVLEELKKVNSKSSNNAIYSTADNASFSQGLTDSNTNVSITEGKEKSIEERLFTDGIFELSDQLQKLREIHISGLINQEEYCAIRQKWINAVLSEPLFKNKKQKNRAKKDKLISNNNKDDKLEVNTENVIPNSMDNTTIAEFNDNLNKSSLQNQ